MRKTITIIIVSILLIAVISLVACSNNGQYNPDGGYKGDNASGG